MLKVCLNICFLATFYLVSVFLLSRPAIAAPAVASNGIIVNPSVKNLFIPADQHTATFPMHVTNNTKAEVTLSMSMVDFGALDESGGIAFIGEGNNLERKYGLTAWSSLDKPSLTLKPKQSGEVNVTVINRPSLALGGHYGAVLFKLVPPSGSDPQKVKFNQIFSALILAKKGGGGTYDLTLDKVERKKDIYSLPKTIKLRFYNGGNVHVAPGGTIRLIDPLGREVANGTINPEVGRILPETFRTFPTSLKFTNVVWVPGHYQLIVKHNFDEQNSFTTYSSSLLFVNGLGIGLLVCLCLLIILMLWRRKQITKFLRKNIFKKKLKLK